MQKKVVDKNIVKSNLISRDLSWLNFNYRVLSLAQDKSRNLFDRLKFLAISSSNLDEFFAVRIGSLYNYLDYGKKRIDYSGLREIPFKELLLNESKEFVNKQVALFENELTTIFSENGISIITSKDLTLDEKGEVGNYFIKFIYPMLTPTIYDNYHAFPIIRNKSLVLGIVTNDFNGKKKNRKLSFIQIPQNLDSFYELKRNGEPTFISITEIIRDNIDKLYRNVAVESVNVFRITRNADYTLDESDDLEINFIKEVQRKLKKRRTGRVVRIEIESDCNDWMLKALKERWEIDSFNVFKFDTLIDYTRLWQIINHTSFYHLSNKDEDTVSPLNCPDIDNNDDIFELISKNDIMLHHPYNSIEPVLQLLEKAAEDPDVLAIKQTIYRLADDSRITSALLKAAENGIHVSVLFEVKARFDEEKNIREAQKLERAGCSVAYGVGAEKTHSKLLMVVRREEDEVKRYVHLGTGNYNEDTSGLYSDISLLSCNEIYGHDVSEFFNVITGHSSPEYHNYLITAPRDLRNKLIEFIDNEIQFAKANKKAQIVIKVNSLEDDIVINKLYEASNVGVIIKLIVRGICCLRPGRIGLSENIIVKSIVGDYLEHSRLYYFENGGDPFMYGGSADIMVRSFDRRVESLFKIVDEHLKLEVINILASNLKDNVNSYIMNEDGSYYKSGTDDEISFDIYQSFFNLSKDDLNEL